MKLLITITITALSIFSNFEILYSQNITNKLGTNGNYIITNSLSNQNYFFVNSATGNVAIGTNTFDVDNPEQLLVDCGITNSVNAIYTKGTINKYFQFNIRNLSNGNQASTDIVCTADNGTETTFFMDMGINSSGFLYQQGNSIETGKLNDCYLLSSGNDFYIVNNNNSKDILFLSGGTAASNERLRIKSNGKIGIGVTNPSNLLTLSGGAYCNGSTWFNSSDSTLKRDIETLNRYGLEEILKIRPVSYYYKNDSTHSLQIGFIAQEIKNIIPEVVSGNEGEMGISYGNMVPVLVNAIKEQQLQINTQNDINTQQNKEISELRNELRSITQTAGFKSISPLYWVLFISLISAIIYKLKKIRMF